MSSETSTNYLESVDVLVAGGGAAGVNAAIAAARLGARTLLVEKEGFLGGISTGVIDTMYGFYTPGKKPRRIVDGLPYEIVSQLEHQNACFVRPNTYGAGNGITYNQEILKWIYDRMILAAGAKVLLHSEISEIVCAENRITDVIIQGKFGTRHLSPTIIIDATGDADVAYMAGVPCEVVGKDVQGQSLTMTFKVANTDPNVLKHLSHTKLVELMKQANASGKYHLAREEGSFHLTPVAGTVLTNMTRVSNVNPTDVEELTRAEMEGRSQTIEFFKFLKECVPGFEKGELVWISPFVGVRESRRIIGQYVLSEEDVVEGRKHEDDIGECGAPIEDHHAASDTNWRFLEEGTTYGIPLRCLLPETIQNLLVAGRCFSASHRAHASARSIAQIMLMGAAAGYAAGLCIQKGLKTVRVDMTELRNELHQGRVTNHE
jgi:hypothetical protein